MDADTPAIYRSFDELFGYGGPYDFTCQVCKVHFKGDKRPSQGCTVLHELRSCCHYGYEVATTSTLNNPTEKQG